MSGKSLVTPQGRKWGPRPVMQATLILGKETFKGGIHSANSRFFCVIPGKLTQGEL